MRGIPGKIIRKPCKFQGRQSPPKKVRGRKGLGESRILIVVCSIYIDDLAVIFFILGGKNNQTLFDFETVSVKGYRFHHFFMVLPIVLYSDTSSAFVYNMSFIPLFL